MWWYPLGHAMALAEADGLRLLFDPLLDDRHHGDVFEVMPPRTVHAEELRADFIIVSHRHPDHFDIRSLRRLAALDADSVVITGDALVERACLRLGFRTVQHVAPSTRVELDTLRLLTTPSRANDAPIHPDAIEWGVALAADGAIVWNQVDTVHRSVAELTTTIELIESQLASKLQLALVRWCPLLEVEASLAGRIGFPFGTYGEILEQAATIALRDAVVVPSSAGARHSDPWSAMNALVYPVDEARFVRDLSARVQGARVFASTCGGAFEVTAAGVSFDAAGGRPFVTTRERADDREFKPLSIAPLHDPNMAERDEAQMRTMIDAWVRGPLADALAKYTHRFLLEIVYPTATEAWTIAGQVTRTHDAAWDVRNEVAASMLCDVIEGVRHWGDLLLAGALRACSRAYDIGRSGLVRANVPPIFLYAAISYSASVERAVEHELSR
jgi:UDP-MurNAc hydroxylase